MTEPLNADMFYGAGATLFEFAKQLRINQTPAEKLVWERLNSKQLSRLRFRQQHPVVYFIADFYCHKAKLVVEIDGGVHSLPEQFEYDLRRDEELTKHGLKILRFTNHQVFSYLDDAIQQIENAVATTMENENVPTKNLPQGRMNQK